MVNKTHTIARAIGQSARKQVEYAATRKAHTESCIIKTSKPRKSKPKKKDIAGLKDRAESVEGSEVPENIINTAGEAYIKDCCEDFNERMEVSKWNGA